MVGENNSQTLKPRDSGLDKAFPYSHVLLLGATSGIGLAMADKMLQHNIRVTAMGRRQGRLDAWVQQSGANRAHGVALDISQIDAIPRMAMETTQLYPDIDCVVINTGIQQMTDFTSPESVDLPMYHQTMHVNYTAAVSLATAFLPFLSSKKTATSLIFTQSNLAIIPAPSLPGYCASKAALNTFAICLRSQLTDSQSNVKVIEIFPPAVQTERHDYMGAEKGRQLGMPLAEFTDQAWAGLIMDMTRFLSGVFPRRSFFSRSPINAVLFVKPWVSN